MKAFPLYLRYALRSFIRGRSRTVFGAFCVAVGITSVVALGLVAGNFQDAVLGKAQQLNRGDVSVQFPGQGISPEAYQYFARLKAQGRIADYTSLLQLDAGLKNPQGDPGNLSIGNAVAVDPQKFPFYDTVTGNLPSGVSLARLLSHRNDVVVSQAVYDQLHLRIGGPLTVLFRFGGSSTFRVTAIVPDNARDPGFGSGLFPWFAMVSHASIGSYETANDLAASSVYIKTSTTAQADAVKGDIERRFGSIVSPKTVADVARDQANSADGMNKFFRIMGLVAVIIGGIGIINTMLVSARRRNREIAILKAVGMKGRQVILVFTLEALLLALAGTAAGILLGIGASLVVNDITQSMAGFPISWSLHMDAILAGTFVGVVATVLFAYLPVVRASRARPIIAIRADDEVEISGRRLRPLIAGVLGHPVATAGSGLRRLPRGIGGLPRRKGLRTFLLVLGLAALTGYLAVLYTGLFSGPKTAIVGAIAGIVTLVIAGLLIQIFVVIVWLVSKLPSMGRLSLRLALRSMSTQKRRLASTLLALCLGILAIGSITILAQNIKHELAVSLQQRQSFNVAVQVPHDRAAVTRVHALVAQLPGVQHRFDGAIANRATLASVDGVPLNALIQRALHGWRDAFGTHQYSKDNVQQALQSIRAVGGHDLSAVRDRYIMDRGRNLGRSDIGTDHAVVSNDFAQMLGITIGSHVVYADGSHRVPFTVVGIASSNNFIVMAETLVDLRYMERVGLASPSSSHNALVFVDIDSAHLKADVAQLRRHAGWVLDLDSFLEFTKVLDKLALFPEIIAALALFAGVVIIANTVALAMIERRREIGVMKAVGAKRRTVLQFLLLENAIVGFLGAGVGVLLAVVATMLLDKSLFNLSPSFDWPTEAGLVVLGMLLAVAATVLTALPASSEKPMSVLRYE